MAAPGKTVLKSGKTVLQKGEFYHKQTFGPEIINRGAVLLECEWNGGIVESGILMGCFFRSGQFRGGSFWGGVFWDGEWIDGVWENGFDRSGRYRPRTDHPPHHPS